MESVIAWHDFHEEKRIIRFEISKTTKKQHTMQVIIVQQQPMGVQSFNNEDEASSVFRNLTQNQILLH